MSADRFQRNPNVVSRPLVRAKLEFEPAQPLDGPVTTGPLIAVRRPLVRGTLHMEPVVPTYLELILTFRPDTDADTVNRIFDKLTTLVQLLGEMEIGNGGKGLRLDAARSGVRPGPAVGLVLVPNDPDRAAGRLWTLAQFLTTAMREYPNKARVEARVVSADEAERYEVAA